MRKTRQISKQLNALLAVFALSLFVSGCDKHQQITHDLDALHDRLVEFTGISSPPVDVKLHLDAPQKSSMRVNTTEIQINLREFYALDECQLSKIVAERNTSLGKTQLPSVRYTYEKTLINALDSCIKQLKDDNNMKTKLQTWRLQKQKDLPRVWANMLTQSHESYNAFAISADFISGDDDDQFQAARLALNYLLNAENASTLETHMKVLQDSRIFARMWRTQTLITQYLAYMTPLLETYLTQNTCATRQDKDDIIIMRNIFRLFFAEKIQSVASQLNHYHYQMKPLLDDLVQRLSNIDNATGVFAEYIESQYVDGHNQYKAAMQAYVQLWQTTFKHCE